MRNSFVSSNKMWLNIIVNKKCIALSKIGTQFFFVFAIVYLDLFLASSLIDIYTIQ